MEMIIDKKMLSDKDLVELREVFEIKYCKMKGWKKSNLTTEQIVEITSQAEWKNPGMLKS